MATSTLYEITADLVALAETEGAVPLEQLAAFRAELITTGERQTDKAEALGRFIKQLEANAKFAREEAKRCQDHARMQENAAERLRQYALTVLMTLPPDDKGKPAKIAGRTLSFNQRNAKSSVEILDGELVPLEYKTVRLEIPGVYWLEFCDLVAHAASLPVMASFDKEWSIDKNKIAAAIKRDETVPGAEMMLGGTELIIR